jgi:hypothetical protein
MENGNSFALIMIVLGLIILIAGCGVAIQRHQEDRKEKELGSDLETLVDSVVNDHTAGSGALSLSLLSGSNIRLDEGRSARISVETMDGDVLVLFFPDEETFLQNEDDKSPSILRTLPVSTDDGRVLPGKLEVTLNG